MNQTLQRLQLYSSVPIVLGLARANYPTWTGNGAVQRIWFKQNPTAYKYLAFKSWVASFWLMQDEGSLVSLVHPNLNHSGPVLGTLPASLSIPYPVKAKSGPISLGLYVALAVVLQWEFLPGTGFRFCAICVQLVLAFPLMALWTESQFLTSSLPSG